MASVISIPTGWDNQRPLGERGDEAESAARLQQWMRVCRWRR